MNIGAFNLGDAIGAAAGGAVLQAGLGYAAVPVAGAALAAVGLALVLVQRRMVPAAMPYGGDAACNAAPP